MAARSIVVILAAAAFLAVSTCASAAAGAYGTEWEPSSNVRTSLDYIFLPKAAQVTTLSSYDSCQKLAPLECGFVVASKDTVLYPSGLLEFTWFTGMCSQACLDFINTSPECKAEPAIQLLTLDACQAYECGNSVRDACGPTVDSQLIDHEKACSTACASSMTTDLCDGMKPYLPGWEAFESAAGPASSECANSDCQTRLAFSCPSYDAEAHNVMAPDLCLDECWQSAKTAECLNSDISIIDATGGRVADWAESAGNTSLWGPESDRCAAATDVVFYTSNFKAIFPDLDLEDVQAIADEFEAAYQAAIKDALGTLGIDPDTVMVDILNITSGSVVVDTELTFESSSDRDLFESVKDSFASMASSSFSGLGELEISDLDVEEAAGAEAGQSDPAEYVDRSPEGEVVDVTLQNDEPSQPDGGGGGGMSTGTIIAIAFASLIGGLVLIVGIVFLARRKTDEEEPAEAPSREATAV